MVRQYLEGTGLFEVDIERTRFIWKWVREEKWLPLAGTGESEKLKEPKPDPGFDPDFPKYDVVVSNFGWKAAGCPEKAKAAFETYMREGGGLVVVHAADNSWPEWKEFNRMIGLGGWGGRSEKDGPYVYYNGKGEIVRDESPGKCGHHGPQNEFLVTICERIEPNYMTSPVECRKRCWNWSVPGRSRPSGSPKWRGTRPRGRSPEASWAVKPGISNSRWSQMKEEWRSNNWERC